MLWLIKRLEWIPLRGFLFPWGDLRLGLDLPIKKKKKFHCYIIKNIYNIVVLTLSFAVGFAVSDWRSRNWFAIGRDAPAVARPLMTLKIPIIFFLLVKNKKVKRNRCCCLYDHTWISAKRPSSLHSGIKVSPVLAATLLLLFFFCPAWWWWFVSFNRRAVRWASLLSAMHRFSSPVIV